jgi:hypothetical protein
MCWYSAEHVGQETLQAEIGQRLCVRKMHWDVTRWVVRESDLETKRPSPVCLLDGTRVVFRTTEAEQALLQLPPEPLAVFRMLQRPRRDVFEFAGGRTLEMNQLPPGLIMDVLVIPGKEELSTLVTMESAPEPEPEPVEARDEPLLARVLRFF